MPVKRLSKIGEFGLIRRIRAKSSFLDKRIIIGIGDDAAVFKVTPGKVVVATTDLLMENVHFSRKWASWQQIGEKALATNLSDLAAMGAVEPIGYLVGVFLPVDTSVDIVDNLYQGMEKVARKYKLSLLGGDTVASSEKVAISITLFGEAEREDILTRGGAKLGDIVFAGGPLGRSTAGLVALKKGLKNNKKLKKMILEHLLPQPQLGLAKMLAKQKLANSMIDCSDGLDLSLKFIAEESKVGIKIYLDQIPIDKETSFWANHWGINPCSWALYGGEDYQLIFTASPKNTKKILSLDSGITSIGEVVAGQGITYLNAHGKEVKIAGHGYEHFKK